nr:hypothetical protein [uncultured Flavobacterium sp.]
MLNTLNYSDLQAGDLIRICNDNRLLKIPFKDLKFLHPIEFFEIEILNDNGLCKYIDSKTKLHISEIERSINSFYIVLRGQANKELFLNSQFFNIEISREEQLEIAKKYFLI